MNGKSINYKDLNCSINKRSLILYLDSGLSEEPSISSAEKSPGIIARGSGKSGSSLPLIPLGLGSDFSVFSLGPYPQTPMFIFLHLSWPHIQKNFIKTYYLPQSFLLKCSAIPIRSGYKFLSTTSNFLEHTIYLIILVTIIWN